MNNVVLVGRLTRDVELKYIPGSGTPLSRFSIAVDREYTGKEGKKETDFIDIQVWGKLAENCANYIGKGSLVAVVGSIKSDIYIKDDEKRKATYINANKIQFLSAGKKGNSQQNETPNFEPVFDDDLPF